MNELENLFARLLKKRYQKELAMTITIRRIEQSDHEYFAYLKSMCGKATYFLYFSDDIAGAMVLHNFVEMLRRHFHNDEVKLNLHDSTIQLKNAHLLSFLKEPQSMQTPPASE